MRQEKSSLLRNKGFQSLLASLLCIVLGLLIGYIVLLIINPAGAGEAIRTIVENFLYYPSAAARLRISATSSSPATERGGSPKRSQSSSMVSLQSSSVRMAAIFL